jgi:hypothetical protein
MLESFNKNPKYEMLTKIQPLGATVFSADRWING